MYWFEQSRVQYAPRYVQLYTAYNTWYTRATGTSSDHEALLRLRYRFVIWREYVEGCSLVSMRGDVEAISRLTTITPLRSTPSWDGVVRGWDDWRGLLHFWYRVRCDVVHGALHPQSTNGGDIVAFAYHSLHAFMSEIVCRMERALDGTEQQRLRELTLLRQAQGGLDSEQTAEEARLFDRCIHAPTIWQVDMSCGEKSPLYSSGEKRYNQGYTPWDNAVSCEK